MKYEDQIEKILQEFDWTRVWVAMNATGWTYWDAPGTPSYERLRQQARDLLNDVASGKTTEVYSGGFKAYLDHGFLILEFILTESEAETE